MGELIAWSLAVPAALVVFAGLCVLTGRRRPGFLRTWVRLASLPLMLTPAPVPDFPGHFAPAYMVALFEMLFQIDGRPGQSLKLLLAACLAAAALALLWSWLRPKPTP